MLRTSLVLLSAMLAMGFGSSTVHAEGMKARVKQAVEILAAKQKSSRPIPKTLLEKAKAVAIIEVSRGGIGVGGSDGSGIILARTPNGQWSAPVAFNQSGASVGLQLGFEEKRFIYVIMTDELLQKFLGNGGLKFDAKATGTAGPDNVSEDATSFSDMYVYQTSDGAFGGATIGGQGVSVDQDVNREAYGEEVVTSEITDGKVKAPEYAARLYELLKLSK